MIKKAVKYTLSFLLYYSGTVALLRWIQIQKKQNKFTILVYHRVNDDLEGFSPVLSITRFRKHMVYLKRYYKIVNLSETVAYIKCDKKIPSEAVTVTFDDGYKDIINNAFPIIKELDIPITVFLTSDCISNNKMLWTNALYFSFKEQNRLNEFHQFKENLKNVKNEDRIKAIEVFKPKSKKNLMLNWEEVKNLSKDKHIEIGAHTRTHPILTQTDINVALKEISMSKKDIEQMVQRPIVGFSYPAGKFNSEVKKLVKESGFIYACSVDRKFNTKESDLYSLSRINIDNCPVFVFATELCGVVNWLRKACAAFQ